MKNMNACLLPDQNRGRRCCRKNLYNVKREAPTQKVRDEEERVESTKELPL